MQRAFRPEASRVQCIGVMQVCCTPYNQLRPRDPSALKRPKVTPLKVGLLLHTFILVLTPCTSFIRLSVRRWHQLCWLNAGC